MKKLILLFAALSIFIGCQEDKIEESPLPSESLTKVNSCEGCHTNYDHLKKVYTPDPPATGGGGCGGDIPHYEPYDRVYLGGNGYEEFKNGMHGKISCVTCHNGVDGTDDKDEAHSKDFIKHPSMHAKEKCGTCHPKIVNKTTNSLHEQGWGQKRMVVQRSGVGEHPTDFDKLTELMQEGYNTNCAKCHATCGDCHITRPIQGGGGLYKGHQFSKPDMLDNCVTCHVSRGGHAYLGQAIGTVPDVHLTKANYKCIDCHTKDEIHGDGNIYETRYEMPQLPECQDCHTDLANSNPFHSVHMETMNCYACHSQEYNNCGSCHINGEGARIAAYQDFKIGLNPIPDLKPYKFVTLRRSLSAPDSWKEYGTPNLNNFDVAPTFKYTTPHNIIRITSRTGEKIDGEWQTYANCTQGCHINGEKNKDLFLFESDLEDWEKPANKGIIVDGKLPSGWGQ